MLFRKFLSMRLRRVLLTLCAAPLCAIAGMGGYTAWRATSSNQSSICHGDVVSGRLERGRRLLYSGENYRAYSFLGFLLGRTFLHSAVRDSMSDAYAELSKSHPDLRFVYGESSWAWGGSFWPHKSHANGTAADFFVPVRSVDGAVSELPTWPWNLFGYAVQFDAAGRSGSSMIDFEAMALHLLALERAARSRGIGIRRIIFDISLQPRLTATGSGAHVVRLLTFNRQQAWVRHDEHYHVDFAVPCR
jgi:penicillin-insensitive murein endopeptidase